MNRETEVCVCEKQLNREKDSNKEVTKLCVCVCVCERESERVNCMYMSHVRKTEIQCEKTFFQSLYMKEKAGKSIVSKCDFMYGCVLQSMHWI